MMSTDQPASSDDTTTFWADLRDTFQGKPMDFTSGGMGRAIALLAIPMVLEMLMQSIFGVVDVYFVGRLGADAVAAVGMTESLLVLVFAIGLGISMAATAMVARRIGEQKPDQASVVVFQTLVATVLISIPVTFIGLFFSEDLMRLMGATQSVIDIGSTYCTIILASNLIMLVIFLFNAVFRGAGDAILSMKVLWVANLINIVLDPMFIFGFGPIPAMGVTGAAVATTIGRSIAVIYQVYLILGSKGRIRLRSEHIQFRPDLIKRVFGIALPGMMQYMISTASWMILFRILATFGSEALAGYTIAIRILVFAILPSWGMANAAATLVGQNLGAGQPERAERSVWLTSFWNMGFLGIVALIMFFFAEPLSRIFTSDLPVIKVSAEGLQIISYTYIFFALGMVMVQAFNGAGDTRTPTWINLFCYWVLQIPLAYLLAIPLGYGPNGVFGAVAFAQAILAVVSMVWFRRGSWKAKAV